MKKNKFKDFLYNYSDFIVAIVILLVVSFIVMHRVNIIMSYPDTINEKIRDKANVELQKNSEQEKNKKAAAERAAEDKKVKKEIKANAEKHKADKKENTNNNKVGESAKWNDGKLSKQITLTIPSGSEDMAIETLVNYNLFHSKHDFRKICKRFGRKPSEIKAGTYTLKKGYTKEKIVKKVTL